ncbi:ATP-binding protein [Actinomadura sp. K4S16]|uniref:ATP-binding protein n=1 Tax=Actinomadura sp. K4S16 TaxID=1316147 RepID=UPI0011EBFCAB|nr:ATP-binding protein [Actinomadura sp. K4S16]
MTIRMGHCNAHQEFRRDLLPIPSSVPLGRDLAEVHLNKWGLAALADDTTLIVSELLTNALAAGQGMITLTLTLSGGVLTIEVADIGSGRPRRRRARKDDVNGRGLQIVEYLAESWGHRSTLNGGKVVWARCLIS